VINGQQFHLSAGESYVIDTGLPHSFTNRAEIPCRIVSAHTPANF
jgi:HTH-type transcriptional repressor of puuD